MSRKDKIIIKPQSFYSVIIFVHIPACSSKSKFPFTVVKTSACLSFFLFAFPYQYFADSQSSLQLLSLTLILFIHSSVVLFLTLYCIFLLDNVLDLKFNLSKMELILPTPSLPQLFLLTFLWLLFSFFLFFFIK